MFYINDNGFISEGFASLEEAKEAATNNACYTQQDIYILYAEDESHTDPNFDWIVARRRYYGVAYDPDDSIFETSEIIDYGNGFYGGWE